MDYELIPLLGLIYGIYLQFNLIKSIGNTLPFIEVTLSLSGLQLLIAPYLDYNYYHNDVFGIMDVPSIEYFSFMLPAILAIHIGMKLGFPKRKDRQELDFFNKIRSQKKKYLKIGINLIIVGYIAYFLKMLPIPAAFNFIIVIVDFLKYLGFFYIWICGSKYTSAIFAIVFIPFVIEAINATIFIDLIIWSFFLISTYAFQKKLNKILVVAIGFIGFSFLFTLQTVKYSYRAIVWKQETSSVIANLGLLANMMQTAVFDMDEETFKIAGGNVNVRVNQGWIITDVMHHYDKEREFPEGKWFYRELVGILLPRFLYPSKPVVGDHDKFEQFTGWRMADSTSMNVGVPGDGYGNFGLTGGILFCLGFGYFVGFSLKKLYAASYKNPDTILWGILIFFYVMRAGNEFYIIANWIVKTGIFTFLFFYFFKTPPIRRLNVNPTSLKV